MYILNANEIKQISGGYEQNFADALEVMSIFSNTLAFAGGLGGAAIYYADIANVSLVGTLLAKSTGVTIVNLPIAIFTGIGVGAAVGTILGAGLYYSGVIFKE